jgi:hypothetical protein
MLLRNIVRNTFKNKRNYCRCPEDDNFFSTTFKVNSFILLATLFINSNFIRHDYAVHKQFNELKDKIDKLEKKPEIQNKK